MAAVQLLLIKFHTLEPCAASYVYKYSIYIIISECFSPRPSACVSQIQDISVETEDNKEKKSAKDALLLWCQMKSAG